MPSPSPRSSSPRRPSLGHSTPPSPPDLPDLPRSPRSHPDLTPSSSPPAPSSYAFAVNFFIGCTIVLLSVLLLHLLLFWSTLTTGSGGGRPQQWLTEGTRRLFFAAIAGLTVLEMTYRIYRSFRTVPTPLFLAYTLYIVALTCTLSGISLFFALRLRKQTKAGRQARRRAIVADLDEDEAARVAKKLKAVGDYTTKATRLIIQINVLAIVTLVVTAIYSVAIGVFGYTAHYHLAYFLVTDICKVVAGMFGSYLLRPPPTNVRKRRMSIGSGLSVSHTSAQSASDRRASIVVASNTSVEMVPMGQSSTGTPASGPAGATLGAESDAETERRKRGMSKVRFADGEDASSGAGDGLATEGPHPIVVEEDAIELDFAAAEMSSEDEHMIALGIRTSSASERLSTASRVSTT